LLVIVMQVSPAVSSVATSKAGRNAIVTSMVICCGFVVCWSVGQITYFLLFTGYIFDSTSWFYHFTNVIAPIV